MAKVRVSLAILLFLIVFLATWVFGLGVPVHDVSGIYASIGLDVYRDSNCTQKISSIDWGNISLGGSKSVTVYVRNEGTTTLGLSFAVQNFVPNGISSYLGVIWTFVGRKVEVGKVVKAIATLTVSRLAGGFSSFSFDMVFQGVTYVFGYMNVDGKVDMYDALIFAASYGARPGDSTWNPDCDLNNDGVINIYDALLFARSFG